jgi:hypothetical protein
MYVCMGFPMYADSDCEPPRYRCSLCMRKGLKCQWGSMTLSFKTILVRWWRGVYLNWLIIDLTLGAWLLAKANLLDGRSATTNKYYWGKTANYPLVDWKPSARWVVDGKYWTSSGVSAGMDMAISFVSAYFGKELAKMSYQVRRVIWVT